MKTRSYPALVLIVLVTFMLSFFISNRLFRADLAGWKRIISSDGLGYYAYLPAVFIDQDLSFKKVRDREAKILKYPRYEPSYLVKSGGHILNKYFCGEALLLLPFFLLATLFSWVSGTEIDGYSFYYQLFTGIGALFYLALGLYFLMRIMQYLGIRPSINGFILAVILLGTNLFYYSLWVPSMSHVYSFFAINGFLLAMCRNIRELKVRRALLAGFFMAMIILIRPTNLIVLVVVPFLFHDPGEFKRFMVQIFHKKLILVYFILAILLLVSLQPVLWYLQSGRFLLWPYRNEGFRFAHPQVMNVLFSYRKGLFIYTPLILLSLVGLIPLLFSNRLRFFSMALFTGSAIYIIASWWNWYYGDGFGHRAFIDFYGIFALLLAILFNQITYKYSGILVVIFFLPFIALNLFQTWQYKEEIIHPCAMNKVKFDYVFLKADSSFYKCLGSWDDMPPYSVNISNPLHVYINDFESDTLQNWNPGSTRNTPEAFSGRKAGYIDSVYVYSPGLDLRINKLSPVPVTFYITGSFMVRDSSAGASNKALLVMSMDSISPGENWWFGFPVNEIPVNPPMVWRKCQFSLEVPVIHNPVGRLKIYIWNTGKKSFLIDDFNLTFYIDRKGED